MENIRNEGVDPTEKQHEEEALKVVSDDELRSQVIEKYGLEEDDNPDLIDKLVEDRKEGQKNLSTAIRQKIDWRAKAQTPKEKEEGTPPKETPPPQVDIDAVVNAKFEERDLALLDLGDEVKAEVKAYAKAKGVSVHEAAKSEYIGFLRTKEEDKIREREASASTKGTGKTAKRDFSKLADEDIRNLSDEEFTAYKEHLKSQE